MTTQNSWLREHAGVIITGCFTVVAALVSGIFHVVANGDSANGSGQSATPTATSTSTTPATATNSSTPTTSPTTSSQAVECAKSFAVTKPADGAEISARGGTVLEGTACPTDLVWVLDYDPTDGSYFQVNEHPIPVVGGKWIQVDRPIGDKQDEIGTVYSIVAMKVSQTCSDRFENAVPDPSGTVWFNPLPKPCPTLKNDKFVRVVKVVKARP